ncbi:pitrilysin family protein [Methylobacterium sp. BTF04]|uniref:M16 family metallopeptidase n=1 Tax=Methylobacterium sp. BTF04 TaxID=2708300 RepID=UPI001FEDE046|nr:pitrilysin family protein [Methylobacterium sp. BTF04]
MGRNTDRAFELLGIALHAPLFAPEALAQIREAAEARVRKDLGNPNQVAMGAFFAHGFPGHPYGRSVDGDLVTLAAIDHADIVAHHRRTITRGNLRVAVVGAIGADALGDALDRAFLDLPVAESAPPPLTRMAGLGERIVTRLDAPQSTIYFGRPGIMRHDPDFAAAAVANHCLGGSQVTSRLFRELRELRGLCYAVWTGLYVPDAACGIVGSTSTPNAKVPEALDVIAAEIARLARDGVDAEELATAKGYLVGSHSLRFDSSSSIANHLLTLQLEGRARSWLDARNAAIAAVTREDVARAVHRLVGDGSLLVTIAGDPPAA